ncbi:MAG TPA: hypothetical protein VFQ53_12620 [Kofleriaceae bacterium]|nr:hypothetical protein [Kofleriaceae bacterium]
MRTLGLASIITCTVMVTAVRAEPAQVYAQQGEQLAKQGRLDEALAAFRAADRIEKRASHACLMALAYLRRAQWTHAELYLAICQQRATVQDPAPEWAPLAEQQLQERLERVQLAAIDLRVEPGNKFVKVALPAFAPGEEIAPQVVHLPIGRHSITALMPGHEPVTQTIEVTDHDARVVTLTFKDPPTIVRPQRSRVPVVIGGIGGATIAAGIAYHVLAFRPARNELAAASNDDDYERYDRSERSFDVRRDVTIGLYGAGAALVVTGVVLRYTVYRDTPESAPRVSARINGDGAIVGLEWRR